MVHIKVARAVLDHCRFDGMDMTQYYIGSLAPDGAHHRKNYNYLVDRKLAHLEEDDAVRWMDNVDALLAAQRSDMNFPFYLGYAIHILTDIYWQETVFESFHQQYKHMTDIVFINERKAYMAEMCHIDSRLYIDEKMETKVWPYLRCAVGIDFLPYVSAIEIEKEKELTLSWYENEENYPALYPSIVTYQNVVDFTDHAAGRISQRL